MNAKNLCALLLALSLTSCGEAPPAGGGAGAGAAPSAPAPPPRGAGSLSMDAEALRRKLVEVGVGPPAEALAKLASPCVRLAADTSGRPEPTTRLGGNPWLPADAKWPERGGAPLGFLAQIRCEELPEGVVPELPARGVLTFFYVQDQSVWGGEESDRDGWRVLFHEQAEACVEHEPPAGVVADARYRPVPQRAVAATSLPDWQDARVEALALTDAQSEAYFDFYYEFRRAVGAGHQVGGHEAPIQGLSRPGPDWVLLLQLESDEAPGWMWGDVGCLYFWIERAALARRDFRGVRMEFQCH